MERVGVCAAHPFEPNVSLEREHSSTLDFTVVGVILIAMPCMRFRVDGSNDVWASQ